MLGLFSKPKEEFAWTCGGSAKVSHLKYIKSGGAGEVHAVGFTQRWLTLDDFPEE